MEKKPVYKSPKVSRLDEKESYFGGGPSPDSCYDNGSNAADGCADGSNASGNSGAGCATGFSAAMWCSTGSDGHED